MLGVAGTAVALGKAATIGFERGAMGESLDIASLTSGVVTRTIDEITSGVSNTIDAAKKGELATAALTATQTALAVSGIKDIPTSIATEYAA